MLFTDVPKEKYFRVANGTVIRSVWELEPALQNMGEDTFSYHVNNDRNDVAKWVADVLEDAELSRAVYSLRDKQEMRIAVLRQLVKVLGSNAGVR